MLNSIKDKKVITVFEPVDFKAPNPLDFIEELEIEEKAKANGKLDLPLTNSVNIDTNESTINDHFNLKIMQAKLRVNESYLKLKDEIARINLEGESAELERLSASFSAKARSQKGRLHSELEDAKRSLREIEEDVDTFKRINKIKRSAEYPSSSLMTVAVVLLLFVLESVLNGYFFASGNDFGILGGVLQAGLVALVNLGIGSFVGIFCLRQLNHVTVWRNYVFGALASVFILLLFVYNLFVGHYRTALGNTPDDAAFQAWETFKNDIFALNEFDSWLLFSIGCIIAIFVCIKTYFADDPYPGYGRLSRRLTAAREHVADVEHDWKETLDEMYEEVTTELDELYEKAQLAVSNLNSHHQSMSQQKTILDSYARSLERACDTCIAFYREKNTRYRNTPPPEYFNEPVKTKLDHAFEVQDVLDKREEVQNRFNEISRRKPEIRIELADLYNGLVQEL